MDRLRYSRASRPAPRWIDERDAAQRPENDAIGDPTGLAAGERVPELMKQNNREEREVFERRPNH